MHLFYWLSRYLCLSQLMFVIRLEALRRLILIRRSWTEGDC